MSFLMRQVAHCDVCGHEWLTKKVPSHCAKCKSRKWNSDYRPAESGVRFPRFDPAANVADAKVLEKLVQERTVEYEE